MAVLMNKKEVFEITAKLKILKIEEIQKTGGKLKQQTVKEY